MLRIETASSRSGFAESRRLMWAYARQEKISYFHLLCYEKKPYAIYDEDAFCGCAVQGSMKGCTFILCLFPNAAYCGKASCGPISELLARALHMEQAFIDFIQVKEPCCPAALQPLRQT